MQLNWGPWKSKGNNNQRIHKKQPLHSEMGNFFWKIDVCDVIIDPAVGEY